MFEERGAVLRAVLVLSHLSGASPLVAAASARLFEEEEEEEEEEEV